MYRSIRWAWRKTRQTKKKRDPRTLHPEPTVNTDHILPLLGLGCEYDDDGPYPVAKYAGSRSSFGSYALYDDRLLDKLFAVDGCLFNFG